MIGLLLALYPARWRARYGEEFQAVLESRPLGPFDIADVLLGALDARLALRISETSSANGGHHNMLRIGGYGAIAGGAMVAAGFIGGNVQGGFQTMWLVVFGLGLVGILVAIAGLSGFQAHREPRLAWVAFGMPAIGTLLTITGLVGMAVRGDAPIFGTVSGWDVWAIGLLTMLVGSLLFSFATVRASVFSRRSAIALAVSAALLLASASGVAFGDNVASRVLLAVLVVAFGGSWIALGISALRRGPIRTLAPT
jgi:hypothetical protein